MTTVPSTRAPVILSIATLLAMLGAACGRRDAAASRAESRRPTAGTSLIDSAAAWERSGDVGAAARAYRRLLASASDGATADRARTRLAAIVAGDGPRVRVVVGRVPPLPRAERRDPAVSSTSASRVRPARRPVSSGARRMTAVAAGEAAAPVRSPVRRRRGLSRAGHWVVAKAAGLGAAGGIVVGALIGNVPGAIAMGMASGAAVGAKRVERRAP